MFCPLKFNSATISGSGYPDERTCLCEESKCAWYEEHFVKCAIAVDSYLKGVADHRLEVKEAMRERGEYRY